MNNTEMGKRFYSSIVLMAGMMIVIFLWKSLSAIIDPLVFLFLYSIPSNIAISLFPHEPVLVLMGKTFEPHTLAAVATAGTIVASLLDYYVFVPLLAHKALDDIKMKKGYLMAMQWFSKSPFITIVLAGFTPVPFFIVKFIAFTAKYNMLKYIGAVIVGRFPRYLLLAHIGLAFNIPDYIVIGLFVMLLSIYLVRGVPLIIKQLKLRNNKIAAEVTQKDIMNM